MKSWKKFTGSCNRPIRHPVTKHYDWFALVNKYFKGKIMRTTLTLTEVWPISDRIIRQKYYCITVHYRTVCTSENSLGQTVQTGQQALEHLELFSDYVRGPTPNKIPVMDTCICMCEDPFDCQSSTSDKFVGKVSKIHGYASDLYK